MMLVTVITRTSSVPLSGLQSVNLTPSWTNNIDFYIYKIAKVSKLYAEFLFEQF